MTTCHTGCRVSGMALGPVILSTPEQVPGSLCVVSLALFAFIVGAIVREGAVVPEAVGGV